MAMNRTHVLLLTAALLATPRVGAEVIDLAWQADGRFGRTVAVPAGRFAELCGELKRGQAVRWAFEAGGALDFNIHHHVGADVRYAERTPQVRSANGELVVESTQDYCWMWSNKSATAVTLRIELATR
jgi:hypothetical protein